MQHQNRNEVLVKFIYNYTKENGFPPNVREIGEAIGVSSSSTVHKFLKKTLEEGYIEMHPNIARTIRVSESGKKLAKIS